MNSRLVLCQYHFTHISWAGNRSWCARSHTRPAGHLVCDTAGSPVHPGKSVGCAWVSSGKSEQRQRWRAAVTRPRRPRACSAWHGVVRSRNRHSPSPRHVTGRPGPHRDRGARGGRGSARWGRPGGTYTLKQADGSVSGRADSGERCGENGGTLRVTVRVPWPRS